MKVQGSVLLEQGRDWERVELDLAPPRAGEVLVRVDYAGLCRSDEHRRHGGAGGAGSYPLLGGHEGAGVVTEVGPGVTRLAPGDHVILSPVPSCGLCAFCASGRSRMCDLQANVPTGKLPDGTYRYSLDGTDVGGFCVLGTFADHVVVSEFSCVKIPDWFPRDVGALISCGVPTGWGSAEYAGRIRGGETVMVVGAGGVGINAVQAAAFLGAGQVIVVDPVEFKRDFARTVGATHTAANLEEGGELARHLSQGTGADVTIVTVGVMSAEITSGALEATGKGGRLVMTGTADVAWDVNIQIPGNKLSLYSITMVGVMYGLCNPHYDIPRLARLYDQGHLKLDELITQRYSVDQVAQGYADVREGRVIRGVLEHKHS